MDEDHPLTAEEAAEFRRLLPTLQKMDNATRIARFSWAAVLGVASLFGAYQGIMTILHAAQGKVGP